MPTINSIETDNFNSSERSGIEKNVENGNFIQIDKSNVSSYIQASPFSRENELLDLTISEGKIEWVNEIHRETIVNLTIITTKNIQDKDVYTIEIKKDNEYIYLTSTIRLKEMLDFINLYFVAKAIQLLLLVNLGFKQDFEDND